MADAKISALTTASALAGTEVLPIVQAGSTKKVATDDLTVKNVRSNATTGLLQITGPGVGTTRTMTVPNSNFTAARTDASQTFTGAQTFGSYVEVQSTAVDPTWSSQLVLVGDATYNPKMVYRGNSGYRWSIRNNDIGGNGEFVIRYEEGPLDALSISRTGVATWLGSQIVRAAATQDAVALAGRAGGTGSYKATLTPTTLSADRTVTLPNADTTVPVATQVLTFSGPSAARTITLPDANFTAARTDAAQSFTGDQTLSTGNLVIGTSGKGIDFSADSHATGMTSELLDDYEEGAWTPTVSGGTVAGNAVPQTATGTYTRIGRQVTVTFTLNNVLNSYTTAPTGAVRIGGLPFAFTSDNYCIGLVLGNSTTITKYLAAYSQSGNSYFTIVNADGDINTDFTFLQWSAVRDPYGDFYATLTYFV